MYDIIDRADWLTVTGEGVDKRIAVKVDEMISGNDGDVTLSFVLHELLQPWDQPLCIDIGADKGWVSIFCAKYAQNPRVLAFEPIPLGYQTLQTQVAKYPSIQCFNVAISDCSGNLPFYIYGSDSHSRSNPNTFLPCQTLDQFVKKNELIHFIKIDTEGHEPQILKSIEPMLPRIGSIVFEFSTYWYGTTRDECLEVSTNILEMIATQFEYIYTLSRRWPPFLQGPIKKEEISFVVTKLYENTCQTDILATRSPIESIYTEEIFAEPLTR